MWKKGQEHEVIIHVQKTSIVINIHFNAGLKDENYLNLITMPEGLQYRLTELIHKEKGYYQCWTLENKRNTLMKELFLEGSSQTQECSGETSAQVILLGTTQAVLPLPCPSAVAGGVLGLRATRMSFTLPIVSVHY